MVQPCDLSGKFLCLSPHWQNGNHNSCWEDHLVNLCKVLRTFPGTRSARCKCLLNNENSTNMIEYTWKVFSDVCWPLRGLQRARMTFHSQPCPQRLARSGQREALVRGTGPDLLAPRWIFRPGAVCARGAVRLGSLVPGDAVINPAAVGFSAGPFFLAVGVQTGTVNTGPISMRRRQMWGAAREVGQGEEGAARTSQTPHLPRCCQHDWHLGNTCQWLLSVVTAAVFSLPPPRAPV